MRTRRILLALALLASPGCGEAGPPAEDREPPRPAGVFDPAVAAVGDTVMGLRLLALDARPAADEPGAWSGRVQFEGEITLSGEYRPHPADPEVDEVCFFPDPESAARLPRFPRDERTSWLCFTDAARARQALGPGPIGGATVTVDRFVYHFAPTDVYNTARLLRVDAVR